MDIKKEREAFESWWEGFHNGRQIACDYVEEDNSYSVGYANAQWVAWQAKAQAVPEGFVVVSQKDLLELTIAINAVDLATHTESKTNEVREMWQQVALRLMALGISQEPAND